MDLESAAERRIKILLVDSSFHALKTKPYFFRPNKLKNLMVAQIFLTGKYTLHLYCIVFLF